MRVSFACLHESHSNCVILTYKQWSSRGSFDPIVTNDENRGAPPVECAKDALCSGGHLLLDVYRSILHSFVLAL